MVRMFKALGSRLNYANVVATLALFIALGGTSYAALTVTGKNVRNGSLSGKDVKDSSLGTADVKNRSLLGRDFKSGQLPAGPRGGAGATGPAGPAGPPGPTQFAQVKGDGTLVDGTAQSAAADGSGGYLVRFSTRIDRCAGAAASASFPGFDGAFNSVFARLFIGSGAGPGGGSDVNAVRVNLYNSGGVSVTSSFTLLLACP